MSFRVLGLVHSVMLDIQTALAFGQKVEHGILGDFNAGVATLLPGREPSDSEFNALTTLGRAVAPPAPAEASAAVSEEGDTQVSSAQVTEPSAGEPAPSEPHVVDEATAEPSAEHGMSASTIVDLGLNDGSHDAEDESDGA